MTALHLVAQPRAGASESLAPGDRALAHLLAGNVAAFPPLSRQAMVELTLDLCDGVQVLLEGRQRRGIYAFSTEDAVWECGLERCGRDVLISLYRPAGDPCVVAHERRVAISSLVGGLLTALRDAYAHAGAPVDHRERSRLAAKAGATKAKLETLRSAAPGGPAAREPLEVIGRACGGVQVTGSGLAKVFEPEAAHSVQVERADLHSLLTPRSRLSVRARHMLIEVPGSQLFLDTERLLASAREVLASWEAGRMLATRVKMSQFALSLYRTRSDGPVELTARAGRGVSRRGRVQMVSVDSLDWARAIADFATHLAEQFCLLAPEQSRNLRLADLRATAAEVMDRASAREDVLTNPRPEAYRRFAKGRRSMSTGLWEQGGKMKFSARWVATVPGLDLRSTFLCGDSLIVDSSRETACIDCSSGAIQWRSPSGPAACTVSPAGLIRFRPDGHLSSLCIKTGEVTFATQLRPRTGGGAAGSVVHAEGLPKLLAVTEGDRQISAVDLLTGQIRWRHTATRPGTYRLRRVGKLLLVAGGSSSLFALDVTTGEAVWRHCSRLPFTGALAVDRSSVLAITGAPATWQLHHIDPWTGTGQWSADLVEAPLAGKPPLLTSRVVVVPVGTDDAAGAEAFDRETGRSLWRHHAELASPTSAWLAFDDMVVVNDAAGVLVCLEATTGRPLFNHVFAGSCDADTPRRLEPVLRSGALFVPQQQVHVVRPRTGEVIGTVPPELVPDLLRVDERCNVYVGEESGHLAAFSTTPRLAVV